MHSDASLCPVTTGTNSANAAAPSPTEPDDFKSWTKANRSTWDERASIHLHDTSGFYAIDRFRSGEDTLLDIEAAEIGDVRGKRMLHLQCHLALDTLCLARRGAIVTGLDFSGNAIAGARQIAADTGVPATFVRADVYDARRVLNGHFDVVFVSWGSLNWLPDIRRWGEIVAALLAPGGYLYLVEQHPFVAGMKEIEGELRPSYDWRTPPDRPVVTNTPTAYNGDQTRLVHTRMHEWDHPLSDVIGALIGAGLRLDFFHEHEVIPWRRLPMMVPVTDRLFCLPRTMASMPLSFSLKASKI
jgi:SAM-dependent methyltransferase